MALYMLQVLVNVYIFYHSYTFLLSANQTNFKLTLPREQTQFFIHSWH